MQVALGCALEIVGLGPFTIANNHFASGGLVRAAADRKAARTDRSHRQSGNGRSTACPVSRSPATHLATAGALYSGLASSRREVAACGTVLFTGNHCQLETTVSRQSAISSVTIITADHLSFPAITAGSMRRNGIGDIGRVASRLLAQRRQQPLSGSAELGFAIWSDSWNDQRDRREYIDLLPDRARRHAVEQQQSGPNFSGESRYLRESRQGPTRLVWLTWINTDKECTVMGTTDGSDAVAANISAAREQIREAINSADVVANERIQSLQQVHQARLSQATRVAAALKAQYGANDPRVQTAEAAVTAIQTSSLAGHHSA